jgi:hypothetical protein
MIKPRFEIVQSRAAGSFCNLLGYVANEIPRLARDDKILHVIFYDFAMWIVVGGVSGGAVRCTNSNW